MHEYRRKAMLLIAFAAVFIALIWPVQAQMSMGIWPAKLDANVPFAQRYYTYVYLFNPSKDRDADVAVKFECKNCSEAFDFFGIKGKKTIILDYSIRPERITVERDTGANVSKGVSFSVVNPLLIRNDLTLSNFSVPFWSLNIGKTAVDGEIQATSVSSITSLTVTSRIKITLEGVNPLVLLLSVSLTVFFIVLRFYYKHRKLEKLSM